MESQLGLNPAQSIEPLKILDISAIPCCEHFGLAVSTKRKETPDGGFSSDVEHQKTLFSSLGGAHRASDLKNYKRRRLISTSANIGEAESVEKGPSVEHQDNQNCRTTEVSSS